MTARSDSVHDERRCDRDLQILHMVEPLATAPVGSPVVPSPLNALHLIGFAVAVSRQRGRAVPRIRLQGPPCADLPSPLQSRRGHIPDDPRRTGRWRNNQRPFHRDIRCPERTARAKRSRRNGACANLAATRSLSNSSRAAAAAATRARSVTPGVLPDCWHADLGVENAVRRATTALSRATGHVVPKSSPRSGSAKGTPPRGEFRLTGVRDQGLSRNRRPAPAPCGLSASSKTRSGHAATSRVPPSPRPAGVEARRRSKVGAGASYLCQNSRLKSSQAATRIDQTSADNFFEKARRSATRSSNWRTAVCQRNGEVRA